MITIKQLILLITLTLFLQSCTQKQHDISQFPFLLDEKITVPSVCESEYIKLNSTLAVMDFTNNSTFGKAEVYESKSTRNASIIGGIIVNEEGSGVGVGGVASKKTVNVKRHVDAKLSQALTPLLESKMAQLSGITLVARNDIAKINKELKLQDSGLLDSSSVVELGKLLGAKYIVTGSIDNVEINQRNNEGAAVALNQFTQKHPDEKIQLSGVFGRLLASFTDGLLIKTTITVKLLNVQTGQILHAQTLSDEVHIGKFVNPTYDVYIGGIKASIIDSLDQFYFDFSNQFFNKGYITKIKNDKENSLVQINVGKNDGLRPNEEFEVFTVEESLDPFTKHALCDKILLPVTLKTTSLIGLTHSWLSVEKNSSQLKVLQLVQSKQKKGGFFDF